MRTNWQRPPKLERALQAREVSSFPTRTERTPLRREVATPRTERSHFMLEWHNLWAILGSNSRHEGTSTRLEVPLAGLGEDILHIVSHLKSERG